MVLILAFGAGAAEYLSHLVFWPVGFPCSRGLGESGSTPKPPGSRASLVRLFWYSYKLGQSIFDGIQLPIYYTEAPGLEILQQIEGPVATISDGHLQVCIYACPYITRDPFQGHKAFPKLFVQ